MAGHLLCDPKKACAFPALLGSLLQTSSDKPLQDTTSLIRWGLSNLTPKDRAKVFLGNTLMKWAIKMMRLCERFLGSQTFFFSVFSTEDVRVAHLVVVNRLW